MNPSPHKYQTLLVTIISLGILFLPTYLLFDRLSEIDFLRSTLNWENPDDVDQFASFEEKGKMARIDVFSSLLGIKNRIFKELFIFSSRHSLSIKEAPVLRC
jgi:hypothetical protein